MHITPVNGQANAHPAPEAVAKRPVASAPQQAAPAQDTVILSQAGKDLAAAVSGKTVAEEAKESASVEANEEQGKAKAQTKS